MRIVKFIAAVIMLLPSVLGFSQGIKEALTGSGYPMSYKVDDFPEDYKAVEMAVQGGDFFTSYYSASLFQYSGVTSDQGSSIRLYEALKMTWTRGETVMVEGQKFLVTYKLDVDPIKLASQRSLGATGIENPLMTLHLVRTDSIVSIEPEPEFTKDKLLAAVGTRLGDPPAQVASKKTATLSNLKQISLGLIMYSSDWDDQVPYVQSTRAVAFVTEPYIKNREIWRTFNPNGGTIQFNMALAGASMTQVDNPAEEPMFYESKEWPDGTRIVAFTDGHVKAVNRETWAQLQKSLTRKYKRHGRPLPMNWGASFKFPGE